MQVFNGVRTCPSLSKLFNILFLLSFCFSLCLNYIINQGQSQAQIAFFGVTLVTFVRPEGLLAVNVSSHIWAVFIFFIKQYH